MPHICYIPLAARSDHLMIKGANRYDREGIVQSGRGEGRGGGFISTFLYHSIATRACASGGRGIFASAWIRVRVPFGAERVGSYFFGVESMLIWFSISLAPVGVSTDWKR